MIESQSLFREDLHIIASEPLPVSKINWTKKSQAVFFGCPCMECSLPLRPTCGHVESNVKLTWNIWDVFFFRKNIKYGHFLIWGVFFPYLIWDVKRPLSSNPWFVKIPQRRVFVAAGGTLWLSTWKMLVANRCWTTYGPKALGPCKKHGGFSVI